MRRRVWLIGCAGAARTWGNAGPDGRYLAGSGPDVAGPAGECQGRPSGARTGDDATRFPSRGEAGACSQAASAGALPGPGGTEGRSLRVYRVAVEFGPADMAPVTENPGYQSLLDSSTWTGVTLILPTTVPAT